MSIAKRALMAAQEGSKDDKYYNIARLLNLNYHVLGEDEMRKKLFRYAKKYDLSPKKLGWFVNYVRI